MKDARGIRCSHGSLRVTSETSNLEHSPLQVQILLLLGNCEANDNTMNATALKPSQRQEHKPKATTITNRSGLDKRSEACELNAERDAPPSLGGSRTSAAAAALVS